MKAGILATVKKLNGHIKGIHRHWGHSKASGEEARRCYTRHGYFGAVLGNMTAGDVAEGPTEAAASAAFRS
jgi:hypothetical protein